MRAIATVMLMVFVLFATGCRTMQPVDHGNWSSLQGQVKAGDTVEVVTRDGQVRTFLVTEVTPDALVGADTRVAQEDITRLRVDAVHKGRTFGAAFGGAATAFLILLAAATASALGGG